MINSFSQKKTAVGFALGFAALFFTHLFALSQVAGWHVDEAWGANFAYRIAFEPHFWPFQAMSPYTAAWSHYLAALAFKMLGVSVFVYRLSGLLSVFLGIAMICRALWNWGEQKAAVLFPFVVAFFPALVMNQRWVIEMNTFFVLCAGLILLGLSRIEKMGGRALIAIGAVLGISSHVLFLAPCLALWIFFVLRGSFARVTDRNWVRLIALCVLPFFFIIFFKTSGDDHTKALGLILIASLIFVFPMQMNFQNRKILSLFWLLSLPLMVPFLLFTEGSWLAVFSSGRLQTHFLIGTFFIPICVVLAFYLKKTKHLDWATLSFFPLCLILTQAMVVKPGPRYYEIPFLFVAGALAIAASRLEKRALLGVSILWITLGSLQLGINYWRPDVKGAQIARSFHLWRFHDSSIDMLSTQRLASGLAQEGCRYGDLRLTDDRLNEDLKFLALGDWPASEASKCRLGSGLDIERKSWDEAGNEIPRVGAISMGQFWVLRK